MRFRPQRFWTPKYVRNRLTLDYYQRRNPDKPWWTRNAIQLLEGLLRPSDRMLEWGSGRSTAWLSARVQSIQSIEHDREWYARVRTQLAEQRRDQESLQLLSIEPEADPHSSPYVRVIDSFGEGELDVALVDGEHRGACAVEAVPKVVSGGLVIVDDAHWFLDHPTTSPHSRHGQGHVPGDWTTFSELVGDWRCVWTTDGVTDTAIWIKP